MILVYRLRGRFRERAPEWVTTIGMLWWGFVALLMPQLFNQPYFYPLNLIMAQPFWAIVTILVGMGGIMALTINGLWRPSGHIRAIFAICRVTIWSTLLVASLTTAGRQLGVPTFAMLMTLDTFALWWASGDAKLADEIAKKRKEHGS